MEMSVMSGGVMSRKGRSLMGGFFSKTPVNQQPKQGDEYSYISIGANQFTALAVTLIDALQSNQRVDEEFLKIILARFNQYYPKYIANQAYLTPYERIKLLINSSRKSEVAECLSYVLRQLALDEIFAHPLDYREVFDGLSPQTARNYLRNPDIKLPTSALRALSQALGLTITLSFKEPGKPLRKKETYRCDDLERAMTFEVVIQVQKDQYYSRVKHKGDFTYVGQLAVSAPKPVEMSSEQTGTLAEIISPIASDNKLLFQSYDKWFKKIVYMADVGELLKKHLVDLYIKFLPTQVNSLIKNATFFSMLEQLERKVVVEGVPAEAEKQAIELLARSLAGWISTKQIDPETLFDQIENETVSGYTK